MGSQRVGHDWVTELNWFGTKGGIPGSWVVKNLPANARDMGSIPGLGRSLWEGTDNPLQYSCLGNPMDRGAWWAVVHGVARESDIVQLLSHVWLFVTPRTAACQPSLSITNYQSLLKLMSIKSVMPFNHLILCCPLLLLPSIFPSIRYFPVSQLSATGGQNIGASVLASVLPMNIQDWFPSGWTGWISLQSKGLSRIFSNTTVQKNQFFGTQPSLWPTSLIHTWLLEKT